MLNLGFLVKRSFSIFRFNLKYNFLKYNFSLFFIHYFLYKVWVTIVQKIVHIKYYLEGS